MAELYVNADHGGTVRDLSLETWSTGDGMAGRAPINEHMLVPGTDVVRTSVLLTWADVVTGLLSNRTTAPRIAVTLDLDLHLLRQPVGARQVRFEADVVKAGRSIVVCGVEAFADDDTEPFAGGHATFMGSPNPEHVAPDGFPDHMPGNRGELTRPIAERAGAVTVEPGVVEMPLVVANVNATGALQGGLISLCAEEAVLGQAPGMVVASMALRYLRAVRTGPGRATAQLHHHLARFEVHDAGTGKLATVGTAVLAPAAR